MIRKNIEKKIRNVVRTHIGKSLKQTTTLDGFIQDLVDLFVSSRKKEINVALHEQRKKSSKEGNCPDCKKPWGIKNLKGNRQLDAPVKKGVWFYCTKCKKWKSDKPK